MRMRNIAISAMALVFLTTLGCSKKTEEHADEMKMAPASSTQESAPAPMQGMESEGAPSSEADSHAMGTPEQGQSESPDRNEPSSTE